MSWIRELVIQRVYKQQDCQFFQIFSGLMPKGPVMVKNEIIVLSEASSFEEFYYTKYFSCEVMVFFKLITGHLSK